MTALPEDPEAETQVVSRAIAAHHGWLQAVHNGVDAIHFYRPAHASLFASCPGLPEHWYNHDTPDVTYGPRPRAAANTVGWTLQEILDLENQRGAGWDRDGRWARRLIAAHHRRRTLHLLADAYNALAEGADLATIEPILHQLAG